MTIAERQVMWLCRQIVMVGYCEMCGIGMRLEQHHGLFRSSQRYKLNPYYRYDPELQFCLCDECHKYSAVAPHVDGAAFLQKMKTMGGVVPYRGHRAFKAYRIEAISQGPLVVVSDREVDWDEVYADLKGFRYEKDVAVVTKRGRASKARPKIWTPAAGRRLV